MYSLAHETSATTILGLVNAAMKEETATCAIDTGMPERIEAEDAEALASEVEEPEVPASVQAEEPAEDVAEETEYTEEEETPVQEEDDEEAQEEETKESDPVIVKKEEEEDKKERWKFIKVVWGKAQNIGANINKIIDGITVDEDESDEE